MIRQSILPPNATTFENNVITSFINHLEKREIYIRNLFNSDACDELFLVYLAQFLSVDLEHFHKVSSVEEKRQMIANSVHRHRRKGTFEVLDDALSKIGYVNCLKEIGGYRFLVDVDLTDEHRVNIGELNNTIKKHKNIQSRYHINLKNNFQSPLSMVGISMIKHTFLLKGA